MANWFREDWTTAIKCIAGKWYAFAYKDGDVYSIGDDNPRGYGIWYAKACDRGIQYVATPSPNRAAAYKKAKRWGNYEGEW